MYPRSGFRSGGTCERTLVPIFIPGEHPNVPSFRFFCSGGTSAKTTLWKTTLFLQCVNGRGRSGDRLPEGTQKPFLGPCSPPFAAPALRELRCCHSTHSLLFRGSVGITRGGQQQFATQTLRVHLLGIEPLGNPDCSGQVWSQIAKGSTADPLWCPLRHPLRRPLRSPPRRPLSRVPPPKRRPVLKGCLTGGGR